MPIQSIIKYWSVFLRIFLKKKNKFTKNNRLNWHEHSHYLLWIKIKDIVILILLCATCVSNASIEETTHLAFLPSIAGLFFLFSFCWVVISFIRWNDTYWFAYVITCSCGIFAECVLLALRINNALFETIFFICIHLFSYRSTYASSNI